MVIYHQYGTEAFAKSKVMKQELNIIRRKNNSSPSDYFGEEKQKRQGRRIEVRETVLKQNQGEQFFKRATHRPACLLTHGAG